MQLSEVESEKWEARELQIVKLERGLPLQTIAKVV